VIHEEIWTPSSSCSTDSDSLRTASVTTTRFTFHSLLHRASNERSLTSRCSISPPSNLHPDPSSRTNRRPDARLGPARVASDRARVNFRLPNAPAAPLPSSFPLRTESRQSHFVSQLGVHLRLFIHSYLVAHIAMATPEARSSEASHKGRKLNRSANQLTRNAACLPCRRRRIKCDAAKPHCTSCVRNYHYLKRTQPNDERDGNGVQCSYEEGELESEGYDLARSVVGKRKEGAHSESVEPSEAAHRLEARVGRSRWSEGIGSVWLTVPPSCKLLFKLQHPDRTLRDHRPYRSRSRYQEAARLFKYLRSIRSHNPSRTMTTLYPTQWSASSMGCPST
jgi:hypothetical protein